MGGGARPCAVARIGSARTADCRAARPTYSPRSRAWHARAYAEAGPDRVRRVSLRAPRRRGNELRARRRAAAALRARRERGRQHDGAHAPAPCGGRERVGAHDAVGAHAHDCDDGDGGVPAQGAVVRLSGAVGARVAPASPRGPCACAFVCVCVCACAFVCVCVHVIRNTYVQSKLSPGQGCSLRAHALELNRDLRRLWRHTIISSSTRVERVCCARTIV